MKKIFLALSLMGLLTAAGCGRYVNLLVSDLKVRTTSNNGQQFLETTFILALGEVSLPAANYELPNDLGIFSLMATNSMSNRVKLLLNLTEIFKLPTTDATLPNGNPIPIDTQGANVIQIPISEIIGSVYLATNNGSTLAGFAFSVSQLDTLGQTLGNLGVFPSFDVGGRTVTAGIFASDEEGKTGLAAFANLGGFEGDTPGDENKPFIPFETTISGKKMKILKHELQKLKNSEKELKLVKVLK